MPEVDRESLLERCGDTTPRDRRNMRLMLLSLAGWAVLFLGANYLIKNALVPTGPVAWAVAAIPTVAAVAAALAYARFLRHADELQRVIQLQAFALGFGAGWVAIAGYPLFERLGAPAADPGDFLLVMVVFFTLGHLVGLRKYR